VSDTASLTAAYWRDRVSPFSCGSEFADWHSNNCGECRDGYDYDAEEFGCRLERALSWACIDDGMIDRDIAMVIGWRPGDKWMPRKCAVRVYGDPSDRTKGLPPPAEPDELQGRLFGSGEGQR